MADLKPSRAVAAEQARQRLVQEAREAGHELQIERQGSVLDEGAGNVVASCTCNRYRSVQGTFKVARNQWGSHVYGVLHGSRPHLRAAS